MLSYLAAAAAGVMLGGVALMLISNWWVHRQGRHAGTYDALVEVPARDVAIVGGTGDYQGRVGDRLRSRLLVALSLYRAHKVKSILVSGVGGLPGSGDEVSSARAWLLARGMDPAHLMIDPSGFRTLDTMQRAARVFGVKSAIACSQPQHLDRTVFLARAAGIDAVGFQAGQRDKLPNYEIRFETLKATLAFVDTYLLHTGPRVAGPAATPAPATVVASTP